MTGGVWLGPGVVVVGGGSVPVVSMCVPTGCSGCWILSGMCWVSVGLSLVTCLETSPPDAVTCWPPTADAAPLPPCDPDPEPVEDTGLSIPDFLAGLGTPTLGMDVNVGSLPFSGKDDSTSSETA